MVTEKAVKIIYHLLRKAYLRRKEPSKYHDGRIWTVIFKLGIRCRKSLTTKKKTTPPPYLRVFNTLGFFNIFTKLSYTFSLGKKLSIINTLNASLTLRSKEFKQSPTLMYCDKLYYNFFCLPNIINFTNIKALLKTLTSTYALKPTS